MSSQFAAFLGYNPMQALLGPLLPHLSHAHAALLTGRRFFPDLISLPFMRGLRAAFDFAIAASLLAAIASWLRGGTFIYQDQDTLAAAALSPRPRGWGPG